MKKVISLIFVAILMVTNLGTYYAAEVYDNDFYSSVNADFISEYGSYIDNNNQMSNFMLMFKNNKKLVEQTAQKVANDEVKLDKNVSHNADLTTAFLKKIYDKDNIELFKEKFKNEEICDDSYLECWYYKCPVLVSMVNTDIITYFIHTNPSSKEIVENIYEIENDVRRGINLYIDSMDLTDATKQSMKDDLNNISIFYYGVNKDFDFYFEHIDREELMKNISSDNETFLSSLSNYVQIPEDRMDYVSPTILSQEIYCPNALSVPNGNYIVVYPAIFLLEDNSNSNFSLKSAVYLALSHEFGHIWNAKYVEKDAESNLRACYPVREHELKEESLAERGYYEAIEQYKKMYPVKEVCEEDRQKLEASAQHIVDELNCVDTGLYYTDGDKEKVKINGLFVYREAAADNFSLNSVTALAKERNEDLSPIFFTFARVFWGTYNLQDFMSNIYPPTIYRVSMGLKLCNNFNVG